eukprot:10605714-Lingulodinium_polyedra.AAC.1
MEAVQDVLRSTQAKAATAEFVAQYPLSSQFMANRRCQCGFRPTCTVPGIEASVRKAVPLAAGGKDLAED